MSIAPLSRVTVLGRVADRDRLLDGLQELGCLHLTPIAKEDSRSPAFDGDIAPEGGTAIANARKALKFLQRAPYVRRQVSLSNDFVLDRFVEKVLAVKKALRQLRDKRDFLAARLASLESWGEIDFPYEGPPGGQRLWFYELPLRQRSALENIDLPWFIAGTDLKTAYTVVIAPDEPSADMLPVQRTHLGASTLSQLRRNIRDVEIEIDDSVADRVALTRYMGLLTTHLYQAENAVGLREARQAGYEDEFLAALQGWAPNDRLNEIGEFARENGLAISLEAPSSTDMPPTLLRQPEKRRAGVDLSLFYQVPGYQSWDPSGLLLISFTCFFAMIMADAGYGLVLAAALAFAWRRLGRSSRGTSYRRLGLGLVSATVLYGIIIGSYFGTSPPETSILQQFKLLAVDDFDVMMRLSIGVGVVHVVIANFMAMRVNWGRPIVFAKSGWILACLSGYGLYLGSSDPLIASASQGGLAFSAVLILLFSSNETATTLKGQVQRVLKGASALAGAMTAFGDVLSYMRLFALGLASASLATTFNQLAMDAHSALPGLGLLAAVLILIVGHALNFALAIISGVVHGLRLNYIEFFKWGFDGEGMAFKPFRKKRMELEIDQQVSS
ncbi:MAG: V-type ATP synthase subunit I [Pseudomonadota bacterium]